MKKTITLAIIALFYVSIAFAQTSEEKPTTVSETMYIMTKRGLEDKFEAAIKAHDLKYHPDGPYKAGLRKVEYGEKAGWYIWIFGPTTYSAIDTRPKKEAGHDDDWTKTIDPLIETYGETSLWDFNPDLSYGMDILRKSNYYEVWRVQLKRGQYYRFKAIAEKLKKAYEADGKSAFLVYNNPIHTSNLGDVALLWNFNTYAEWSADPGIKKTYEKLFGEGSWQHMLDEWNDVLVNYNAEVRSIIR